MLLGNPEPHNLLQNFSNFRLGYQPIDFLCQDARILLKESEIKPTRPGFKITQEMSLALSKSIKIFYASVTSI